MTERRPIVEEDPDFGFPTPQESAALGRYYKGESGAHSDELLRAAYPLAYPTGSQEASRIQTQIFAAQRTKALYHREVRSEIPRKMLDATKSITVDDIYAMLNVYYWWDEEEVEVHDCLESLVRDLSQEQFKQAVRVLHAEFADFCDTAPTRGVCERDGLTCFEKLVKDDGDMKLADVYDDARDRFDYLEDVLGDAISDYMRNDGQPGLIDAIKAYNIRTLSAAGLTELEACDSANVLDLEAERREGPGAGEKNSLYHRHLISGGDIESFISDALPRYFIRDENIRDLIEDFEDLPDDVLEWDESKKLALARRAVAADEDYHRLAKVTEEWEVYGVLPPYLYRFRPDGVFPGEI